MLHQRWAPETLETAARVPAWTRPERPRFTASCGTPPGGFNAWVSPEPPVEPLAVEIAPPSPAIDVEAMQAEAFAAGFDEGQESALAAFEDERAALGRLAGALEAFRPEPAADLGRLIAEAVKRLVAQAVGEAAIDPALTEARARAVAELVAEEAGPARLRLHPEDVRRLADAGLGVALVPDPSLAEGTILAETASGWIEDGPAIRLERLRGLLDQLGCR